MNTAHENESTVARKLRLVSEGKLSKERALSQLMSLRASRIIAKEFGETIEAFFERRPDFKSTDEEASVAIRFLEGEMNHGRKTL